MPNTQTTSTNTNHLRKGKSKRAFNPNRFRQEGELLNVTATVPERIHRLIKTEAAINNQSVSTCLLAILEQRYRLVD
jgi:hypothetical protein